MWGDLAFEGVRAVVGWARSSRQERAMRRVVDRWDPTASDRQVGIPCRLRGDSPYPRRWTEGRLELREDGLRAAAMSARTRWWRLPAGGPEIVLRRPSAPGDGAAGAAGMETMALRDGSGRVLQVIAERAHLEILTAGLAACVDVPGPPIPEPIRSRMPWAAVILDDTARPKDDEPLDGRTAPELSVDGRGSWDRNSRSSQSRSSQPESLGPLTGLDIDAVAGHVASRSQSERWRGGESVLRRLGLDGVREQRWWQRDGVRDAVLDPVGYAIGALGIALTVVLLPADAWPSWWPDPIGTTVPASLVAVVAVGAAAVLGRRAHRALADVSLPPPDGPRHSVDGVVVPDGTGRPMLLLFTDAGVLGVGLRHRVFGMVPVRATYTVHGDLVDGGRVLATLPNRVLWPRGRAAALSGDELRAVVTGHAG